MQQITKKSWIFFIFYDLTYKSAAEGVRLYAN